MVKKSLLKKYVKKSMRKKSECVTMNSLKATVARICKKNEPEIKNTDVNITYAIGVANGAGVNAYQLRGPFGANDQGIANSQRLGNQIKLRVLQVQGLIQTQSANTIGGFVDFYVLRYNKGGIGGASSPVPAVAAEYFLKADPVNFTITAHSFRDREHYSDFTVLKRHRVYVPKNQGQEMIRSVKFEVPLKDYKYKFDTPYLSSLTTGGIYILSVASTGNIAAGVLSGFNVYTENRMLYTDA